MNLNDRVICIKGCDGRYPITERGIIIHIGKRPVVQFDWFNRGHDAFGIGKGQRCWVMDWDCIIPEKQKETKMAEKKDRVLYQVIVVEPNSSEILLDKKIVAESHEDVMIECAAEIKTAIKNLHVKDVDIIYHELGGVRGIETCTDVKLVCNAGKYKLVKE